MAGVVQDICLAQEVLMGLITDREARILATVAIASTIGITGFFIAILIRLYR